VMQPETGQYPSILGSCGVQSLVPLHSRVMWSPL
jgi:hypothetical protein